MSIQPVDLTQRRLAFGLSDRLRKSLTANGISVADTADHFGVTRGTVGNWINGHVVPDKRTLMLWSLWLDIPLSWIQTGTWPNENGSDGGQSAPVAPGVVHPPGLEPGTR